MPAHARKVGRIELRLHDVAQLFNSLDPSPFPERDLDQDAEDFIVGWAREYPDHLPLELHIQLAQTPTQPQVEQYVTEGIGNFFTYRKDLTRRRFQELLRRGRLSLLIGLLFLAACLGAADIAARLGEAPLFQITREGFVIAGWVAMWRPMEIFLYDWWPLRHDLRVYDRLSRATVHVLSP